MKWVHNLQATSYKLIFMDEIISKFTTHLKNALTRALVFVVEHNGRDIEPLHLLWALSTQQGCIASEVLRKAGLSSDALTVLVNNYPSASGSEPPPAPPWKGGESTTAPVLSPAAKLVIEKAVLSASKFEHRYVGTEHLLFGLMQAAPPDVMRVFSEYQVQTKNIERNLENVFRTTAAFPDLVAMENALSTETKLGEHGESLLPDESKTPALDFFAVELTHPEAVAPMHPVFGREHEIERWMHILCRRTKNNPVLIGEPGVGKTAIVEGLAKKIIEGAVPSALAEKRIFELDLGSLVAGTMYRGEFESRLRELMDELAEHPEVILFVDELHTIIGAGSGSGSLDAANMLKPALARGLVRMIGATTPTEFKRSIETDGALERRFEPVPVPEPTLEATKKILLGVLPTYEKFHAVRYEPAAVNEALQLAARYLTNKHFPDKAIDLLDEAGAAAHVARIEPKVAKQSLHAVRAELEGIIKAKREAVLAEKFEEAVKLKNREAELRTILEPKTNATDERQVRPVTALDVRKITAAITGLSLDLLESEIERLRELEAELKALIIGQEEAVSTVAKAARRAKLQLASRERPLASFLFVGPTGVGKTELAKQLAAKILARREALLRLDMSEYSESYSVSKLVGSPAGYVGYRDKTALTDHVKAHPDAVVIFDELEKAHPDVQNLLLQILDHGTLKDATGRLINFTQTILIATTNAAQEKFERSNLGFNIAESLPARQNEEIREALHDTFRRELVGRFDQLCLFYPLAEKSLLGIIDQEIKGLQTRLVHHRAELTIEKALRKILLPANTNKHGAREIRRQIESRLEHPIADHLLDCARKQHQIKITSKKNGQFQLTCRAK